MRGCHLWSWLVFGAILPVNASPGEGTGGFDHAHGHSAHVLARHVEGGRVAYAALKADNVALDAYLDALARVDPADFANWSKHQQLAALLNLYNAATLRVIIDHMPLESIRSIGLLPGAAWRMQVVRFGGRVLTLDHLEHKILRVDFAEPRIHFALVCAAMSCPPLRDEPYLADRLDAQLDDQGRRFMAEREKNRFDAVSGTLWLSPIFDWFEADFTANHASVVAFVRPFLPEADQPGLERALGVRVRYTEYDWSLNTNGR